MFRKAGLRRTAGAGIVLLREVADTPIIPLSILRSGEVFFSLRRRSAMSFLRPLPFQSPARQIVSPLGMRLNRLCSRMP
jgi:hypothetical protein